ncbi:hypothetical protein [Candidatus Berkiella aquae]|uniref:Uncharacterized protein n=1 Tax=Candidatus Berkiella aquae TaxID=295108 RepID=A0A0Q9YNU1_9GAMM|nr:hypothetical protein [Candidatus Berkiella aquae]MCS5712156.1 hypothetical protein [Candidatus Berkiella aquae]
MPSNILLSTEQTLFCKIRDKISNHDHSGLYHELLYQGGSLLVNKLTDDHESLLLYAIISGNEIAFDLLVVFGFKLEPNSSQLIVEQLNQSTVQLSEKIYDRMLALASSSYIVNEEALPKFYPPMIVDESDTFTFNTLQSDLTSLGETKYIFKRLFSALFETEEFSALVTEAFNGQRFNVQIVNPDYLYSEGDCCHYTKTIRLANNQSLYSFITTLIFELCNAANTNLATQTFAGSCNADDFAYNMEQAEYLSYERYTRLLPTLRSNLSLASLLWRHNIDFTATVNNEIVNSYASFDSYWNSVNENHGKEYSHSESYRRDFRYYQQLNHHLTSMAEPHTSLETCPSIDIENTFTPGYLAAIQPIPDTIEQYFTSDAAKSFLLLLTQNPMASEILGLYQPAIAQSLARQFNEAKLLAFSKMNPATQTDFILRFAKANKQEIEMPNRSLGCKAA